MFVKVFLFLKGCEVVIGLSSRAPRWPHGRGRSAHSIATVYMYASVGTVSCHGSWPSLALRRGQAHGQWVDLLCWAYAREWLYLLFSSPCVGASLCLVQLHG